MEGTNEPPLSHPLSLTGREGKREKSPPQERKVTREGREEERMGERKERKNGKE